MKNLKYLLLLMVAASLSFVSCTKDDDDDTDGDDKKEMIISKVIRTVDNSYSEYLYNSDNKVIKIANFSPAGVDLNYYEEFTYAGSNLATYMSYSGGNQIYKITYTYNGNKPASAEVMANQGSGLVHDYDVVYTFNGDKISKIELMRDLGSGPVAVKEDLYTYTGSSVTRIDYQLNTGSGLAAAGYDMFEFDSKNNPIHGIGIDYFQGKVTYLMSNNMTKMEKVSAADVVDQAQSVNITYEYDADNNPIKSTSISFDTNNENVSIIEYKEK